MKFFKYIMSDASAFPAMVFIILSMLVMAMTIAILIHLYGSAAILITLVIVWALCGIYCYFEYIESKRQ